MDSSTPNLAGRASRQRIRRDFRNFYHRSRAIETSVSRTCGPREAGVRLLEGRGGGRTVNLCIPAQFDSYRRYPGARGDFIRQEKRHFVTIRPVASTSARKKRKEKRPNSKFECTGAFSGRENSRRVKACRRYCDGSSLRNLTFVYSHPGEKEHLRLVVLMPTVSLSVKSLSQFFVTKTLDHAEHPFLSKVVNIIAYKIEV